MLVEILKADTASKAMLDSFFKAGRGAGRRVRRIDYKA